jgi:sulfatase modifying factor 1
VNPYLPRPIDLPTAVPLDTGDLSIMDEAKIFAAPDDPGQWPVWRAALRRWRSEASDRLAYDGSRYALGGAADCYAVCLAWLWDETLYDHSAGVFTPEKWLSAAQRDFGGFDGVVLWHAYPVIGLDDRNQFDFYRGVPELPALVATLRDAGLRVFVDYNPWDTGTRREPVPDDDAVAKLVADLGADGVFLDTLKEGAESLRSALDAIRPGIVLEGESRVPLARIGDHELSWAQWFADSPVPGVLRAKWFERRHLLHHTRRWHRDHAEELHSAWLNGCGVLVWENVFGVWVGWNARDRAQLRAMLPVQRRHTAWFTEGEWTPLADHPGGGIPVYASRWDRAEGTLWTVVNRGPAHDGAWLVLDDIPGARFVELASGVPLAVRRLDSGQLEVGGGLPAGGIAAVFAAPSPPVVVPSRPAVADPIFPVRVTQRVPAPVVPHPFPPDGMVAMDGGRHELTVHYRLRETGLYGETPYVDEWKPLPPRLHQHATLLRSVQLSPFAIATREVSRADFADFVVATGYTPTAGHSLLAGNLPGNAPATNVDLADARAYAAWAGLRLPTEDEWQLAAGAGVLERGEPLVWNWTESEHYDGRTRFAILKGGSAWLADSSDWYFDGAPQPPEVSAKLLLLGAGMCRSPSIGFRCAADLVEAL